MPLGSETKKYWEELRKHPRLYKIRCLSLIATRKDDRRHFQSDIQKKKNSKAGLRRGKDQSKLMKKLWKNEEFANKIVKAQRLGENKVRNKPNKPETKVLKLCKKLKIKVKFVGNGKLVIGGMNPDIKIVAQKKVIELFGNYWHRDQHPNSRIRKLSKYGWRCLVIWQSELRNLEKVKRRILRFYEL